MTTTGYTDTFGRTVAGGLGSATSGQAYTLFGLASQFSVAPNTASIAVSSVGDKIGYVDRQTADVDIRAQVALSAIPASNLATVGFISKLATISNYYNATMMVATGGAVSLRFSKVIAGALSTIQTTAVAGLTYVANTFYNVHYQCYWSNLLQTNVMSLKLWAVGAVEPGGWMATTTDASITQFTAGTNAGIMARDESTVVGTITAKIQNLAATSYSLPMPALTDPMCYDPAVAYPKQTALQSLAAAADAAMATIDPLTSLAGLFPRVRVSLSSTTLPAGFFLQPSFTAVEFNVGTPTNLGYNPLAIYLPVGIWLIAFELRLVDAAVMSQMRVSLNGPGFASASTPSSTMRTNTTLLNDLAAGGTTRLAATAYSTDPTTPAQVSVSIFPVNTAVAYTVNYAALSAVKISDYF